MYHVTGQAEKSHVLGRTSASIHRAWKESPDLDAYHAVLQNFVNASRRVKCLYLILFVYFLNFIVYVRHVLAAAYCLMFARRAKICCVYLGEIRDSHRGITEAIRWTEMRVDWVGDVQVHATHELNITRASEACLWFTASHIKLNFWIFHSYRFDSVISYSTWPFHEQSGILNTYSDIKFNLLSRTIMTYGSIELLYITSRFVRKQPQRTSIFLN